MDVVLKLIIPVLLLASTSALAASAACENTESVETAIECLQSEVTKAEMEMARYLEAIRKRHAGSRRLSTQVESTHNIWLTFRTNRCRLVGILPRDADKLTAQRLFCHYQDTREHTHRLWETFLTHSDGTPPDLPEPAQVPRSAAQ